MRLRSILFFGFIGVMMGLGLFVNSIFFLLGMVSLCGGHVLLGHGKEHGHDSAAVPDDEKTKSSCH